MPTIKALRAKVQDIAQEEVQKTLQQMGHLSVKDREAIQRMAESLTNKILHEPTRYLKSNGCQNDRSTSLDIARKIFGLND